MEGEKEEGRENEREGGKRGGKKEKIIKRLKILSRFRARGLVQCLTGGRCQGQNGTRVLLPVPSSFCPVVVR